MGTEEIKNKLLVLQEQVIMCQQVLEETEKELLVVHVQTEHPEVKIGDSFISVFGRIITIKDFCKGYMFENNRKIDCIEAVLTDEYKIPLKYLQSSSWEKLTIFNSYFYTKIYFGHEVKFLVVTEAFYMNKNFNLGAIMPEVFV